MIAIAFTPSGASAVQAASAEATPLSGWFCVVKKSRPPHGRSAQEVSYMNTRNLLEYTMRSYISRHLDSVEWAQRSQAPDGLRRVLRRTGLEWAGAWAAVVALSTGSLAPAAAASAAPSRARLPAAYRHARRCPLDGHRPIILSFVVWNSDSKRTNQGQIPHSKSGRLPIYGIKR